MKKLIIYIIFAVLLVVLMYTLPDMIDISPLWLTMIFMIVWYVGIIIEYFDGSNTVDGLNKKILSKLKEDGYTCQMEDGTLVYQMHDRTYRALFRQLGKKNFQAYIQDWAVIDEEWEQIRREGKDVVANYINYNSHQSIKCISLDSGVLCQYTTSVANEKEFLEEAKFAVRVIGDTLGEAQKLMPAVKQSFLQKEQPSHIGFSSNNKSELTQ